ncbi:MAG TPA: glycosyltransferase [Saprospiraceae bacterium]|nr:glycosyltransferase [Saprospiraceae bacterium]HNJ54179.1 glycosyltransferase [Saprospiraceae bacterium]
MKTSSKKTVLIITYYWPPSGGPGVQRCLYFVKYLREFGWEPIVYTVENGEFPYLDNSLEKQIPDGVEVIKKEAWEPFSIYKKLMGLDKTVKLKPNIMVEKTGRPWLHKLSTFVRGNFFIPDARMFWIQPSVKFLKQYTEEHHIDVIMTSSPPHSVQLIGYHLKKLTGIPWLSDYRDPWTKIFFWDKLKMTGWAKRKNEQLENKCLAAADRIVTVSQGCSRDFAALSSKNVEVITNGFDESSNHDLVSARHDLVIGYGGTLSNDRNPELLWQVIGELCNAGVKEGKHLRIQFTGAIDPAVYDSIRDAGLEHHLIVCEALPHDEYLRKIRSSDILLLIGAKDQPGVLTGKLFEYLSFQIPIISISPRGSDIEEILKQTGCGVNADYNSKEEIASALRRVIAMTGASGQFSPNKNEIDQYSRRNLTARLASVLDSMIQ